MASVYIDVSALYVRWDEAAGATVAPDARRAIGLLESDGHRVVPVGPSAALEPDWMRSRRGAPAASPAESGEPAAWLIVGDRGRCRPQVPGLRTILVGGGPPPRTGRGRCDREVPDLASAALVVLGAGDTTS